jgi:hypothetical protein
VCARLCVPQAIEQRRLRNCGRATHRLAGACGESDLVLVWCVIVDCDSGSINADTFAVLLKVRACNHTTPFTPPPSMPVQGVFGDAQSALVSAVFEFLDADHSGALEAPEVFCALNMLCVGDAAEKVRVWCVLGRQDAS